MVHKIAVIRQKSCCILFCTKKDRNSFLGVRCTILPNAKATVLLFLCDYYLYSKHSL